MILTATAVACRSRRLRAVSRAQMHSTRRPLAVLTARSFGAAAVAAAASAHSAQPPTPTTRTAPSPLPPLRECTQRRATTSRTKLQAMATLSRRRSRKRGSRRMRVAVDMSVRAGIGIEGCMERPSRRQAGREFRVLARFTAQRRPRPRTQINTRRQRQLVSTPSTHRYSRRPADLPPPPSGPPPPPPSGPPPRAAEGRLKNGVCRCTVFMREGHSPVSSIFRDSAHLKKRGDGEALM